MIHSGFYSLSAMHKRHFGYPQVLWLTGLIHQELDSASKKYCI